MIEKEDKLSTRPDDRCVYTLTNDVTIEWFQAFIRSLRKTNPTLPLIVIPYDKSVSRLQELRKKYDFTIMDEAECSAFDALEGIVMDQHQKAAMFRKWACFFGRYSNFIFLDSDIVVTSSLDEILDAFSASSYDFIYFDRHLSVVYTPEAEPEMVAKYGSVGFNAGAFASRTGLISHDELRQLSLQAAKDRSKFIIDQVDQPFLNYVFDVSGRRTACISELLPKFAPIAWARQPFVYDWKTNVAINGEGKIMPFIHWAGCAYPTMVRSEIFLRHRTSDFSFPARMEYYGLFYFRRYWTYFLKKKKHWTKVFIQFVTSSAWRKFYLCRLVGVKIKLPL